MPLLQRSKKKKLTHIKTTGTDGREKRKEKKIKVITGIMN